jgi:hypothetical protein
MIETDNSNTLIKKRFKGGSGILSIVISASNNEVAPFKPSTRKIHHQFLPIKRKIFYIFANL